MSLSQILVVIIAGITLTIFAERRQIQAPLLLAGVGLVFSFVPGLPRIELSPETILNLVLPPLLYAAALDFSFPSFMRRIGTILNLGVGLVVATTVAVGALMSAILPGMSLPAALILGAAVAPPDAVSAVAIGRKLGLPNRLTAVLKGESLINDAAALTLFSMAAAAATGGRTLIGNGLLYLLYAAVVGIVVGLSLGRIVHEIRRRLANPTLITALALITPFTAYHLAEELHASGVLAVVFAGFYLGHNAANLGFAGRIQEREVWRVTDTLLEAFIFAYMGLQFRFVLTDALAGGVSLASLVAAALLVFATVVFIRIGWVMGSWAIAHTLHRMQVRRSAARGHAGTPLEPLDWRESVVLSWAGMRGVVTLAAAAGTPMATVAGLPFGERDAIIPLAFAVAIGTLLVQGLTLPWVIRKLGASRVGDLERHRAEMRYARTVLRKAREAALTELQAHRASDADIRTADQLLQRAERGAIARERDAADDAATDGSERAGPAIAIIGVILAKQRQSLIAERDAERLDDQTLRELLEDIDFEQAFVARRMGRQGGL